MYIVITCREEGKRERGREGGREGLFYTIEFCGLLVCIYMYSLVLETDF